MQPEIRNWDSLEFPHSPRTGVIGRPELPPAVSLLHGNESGQHQPLVIAGDETLVPDSSPQKLKATKLVLKRPNNDTPNKISIVESKAAKITFGEGAPITARPANDNELRFPLHVEYLAERLGKNEEENGRNWDTAMWFDGIYRAAMLPDRSLGPLHWFSSGAEFASEDMDRFSATHVIPPEVVSVLNLLDRVERIRRKQRGYDLVGIHECSTDRDPRSPTGVEVRSDASKKLRLLQAGMRGLWKPVKQAIVDHAEIWTLGITQGVSRALAPTAGRQRLLDGLGIAADIRKDIARWEACDHRLKEGTCRRPLDEKGHLCRQNGASLPMTIAVGQRPPRPPTGDPPPHLLL